MQALTINNATRGLSPKEVHVDCFGNKRWGEFAFQQQHLLTDCPIDHIDLFQHFISWKIITMKVKGLNLNLCHPCGCPQFNSPNHVNRSALRFTPRLTSTGIPMVQNRQSYNLKNPTENYTTFPGQNVTLVLYHPPINADLSILRKR